MGELHELNPLSYCFFGEDNLHPWLDWLEQNEISWPTSLAITDWISRFHRKSDVHVGTNIFSSVQTLQKKSTQTAGHKAGIGIVTNPRLLLKGVFRWCRNHHSDQVPVSSCFELWAPRRSATLLFCWPKNLLNESVSPLSSSSFNKTKRWKQMTTIS